jgi:hypothetical protein
MSDDLEARLRDRLRGAPLPAAPETLRDYLDHLPLDVQPSGPPRRQLRPRVLLGVAAIVVLGLGVGTVLVGAPPDVSPTAPPTAPVSVQPTAPRSPSTGVRRFEAPGISFDYPVDWIDQTSTVEFPRIPGVRFVVLLGRGMPVCPPRFGSTSKPTPEPGSCQEQALAPGSMVVSVLELTNPMPGTTGRGPKRKVAGYPAWEEQVSAEPANPTQLQWTIQAPDGSLYLVTAGFPRADLAARRTDIEKVLRSLRLSAWQAPPRHRQWACAPGFSRGFLIRLSGRVDGVLPARRIDDGPRRGDSGVTAGDTSVPNRFVSAIYDPTRRSCN